MGDMGIKEKIIQNLVNDKLFEMIKIKGLEDKLFSHSTISILNEAVQYTSSEFEKLFCNEDLEEFLCKQGVMRTFMKDLSKYLEVGHIGRNMTVSYLGFIKLKMALLLRQANLRPNLIQELAKKSLDQNVEVIFSDNLGENKIIDEKMSIRLQVLDLMIKQAFDAGMLTQDQGELKLTANLFESNKNVDLLKAASEKSVIKLEMQEAYKRLRELDDLSEMTIVLDELLTIKEKVEEEDADLEDYVLRAQEYIENKRMYLLQEELSMIQVQFNSTGIEELTEQLNKLKDKYPSASEKSMIDSVLRLLEERGALEAERAETEKIEKAALDLLSEIASNKFSKKLSLEKIKDVEALIERHPRINTSVKMTLISLKRDLEKTFIQKLFR